MTIKGFHEAAPIVKEIAKQEAILFRISLNQLTVTLSATENKGLPAVEENCSRYLGGEKIILDAIKAVIEEKIKRLNKELESIK